jgi:acid phosphatase (class A)
MKYNLSLVLTVLVLTSIGYGQGQIPQRTLTPARGHYKQLSLLSPKPRTENEPIDKIKFVIDKETIDRRLSRTPYYLQGTSVTDFNIPNAPANSSEQTRAEINYLLALQNQRTTESVRSCLYMADIYYNLSVKPGDETYGAFRKNLFHIGRSIGSWFNPETLPVTAELMANTWRDASYFIWSFKFQYARVRQMSSMLT